MSAEPVSNTPPFPGESEQLAVGGTALPAHGEQEVMTPVAQTGARVESDPSTTAPTVQSPEFANLREGTGRASSGGLDRFYDVHVPIWAELGRVEMPLGDLVKLAEGAVVRLDRPVSDPVDIVSQGIRLARGEVVVIDGCFAVRIKEIIASK